MCFSFFFQTGILSLETITQFPTSPLINNPEQHRIKTLARTCTRPIINVRTRAPPCRAPYKTVIVKVKKNRPHQTRAAAALRWCPSVFLLNASALPSFLTGPRAFDGGDFSFPYNNSVIWCSTRGRSGSNSWVLTT